jgi:hypothetical protein
VHVNELVMVRTRSCAEFKAASGQNNHFLITILVGLDAVKTGSVQKHPDFSTTWNPRDSSRSASRSRAYAINTSLVWITDLVDVYWEGVSRLPAVCTPTDLLQIRGSGDDGRSKRLERYGAHLGVNTTALRMTQLAIHWRNRVAHSVAAGQVAGEVRGGLRAAAAEIADAYNGLDVEALIKHEAAGNAPTFKEVASLMSACHKLVADLDRAALTRIDLGALAEEHIAQHLRSGGGQYWNRRTESLWAGDSAKTRKRIELLLTQAGFRSSAEPISGSTLDASVLEELSSLSLATARSRFPLR